FCCILLFSSLWSEELIHILQKGETLYGISRKYNISTEALMAANKIADPSKLREGQRLSIPKTYTVKKGDTLFGIAREFNVDVERIITINNLKKDSSIRIGDVLLLPVDSAVQNHSESGLKIAEKNNRTQSPDFAGVPLSSVPPKPLEDPRTYTNQKVDKKIVWPVSALDISYLNGKLYGVSITSRLGEKVKTISSGAVLSIGPYRGFGQVVFLQAKSGYIYVYGGLDKISVKPGDTLNFGDEIGNLGSDSLSGKPKLYFMVYNKDVPVDPAKAPRGY
ncbi:MAG: LysM peptidoglycan-binding domain-containing protein, partial [Spirochaetales bacterium]|nr:LysM peptidoglycan-binding domain-containing protein [Spirochaetales bacterium]